MIFSRLSRHKPNQSARRRAKKALSEMNRVFGDEYPEKGMLLAMGTHSLYPDT